MNSFLRHLKNYDNLRMTVSNFLNSDCEIARSATPTNSMLFQLCQHIISTAIFIMVFIAVLTKCYMYS